MQQGEARIDGLLEALRTLRFAIELRDHWKDSMAERLMQIADEAIREEERIQKAEYAESV